VAAVVAHRDRHEAGGVGLLRDGRPADVRSSGPVGVAQQRWRCPTCRRSWTEQDQRIASGRCGLRTRAARQATLQAGRHGHTVPEVATELRCGWHTVMDAVAVYGQR
jgi:transposase-like protein